MKFNQMQLVASSQEGNIVINKYVSSKGVEYVKGFIVTSTKEVSVVCNNVVDIASKRISVEDELTVPMFLTPRGKAQREFNRQMNIALSI